MKIRTVVPLSLLPAGVLLVAAAPAVGALIRIESPGLQASIRSGMS